MVQNPPLQRAVHRVKFRARTYICTQLANPRGPASEVSPLALSGVGWRCVDGDDRKQPDRIGCNPSQARAMRDGLARASEPGLGMTGWHEVVSLLPTERHSCLVNQLSHVLLHASHLPGTANARHFLQLVDRTGKRQKAIGRCTIWHVVSEISTMQAKARIAWSAGLTSLRVIGYVRLRAASIRALVSGS